MTDQEAVIKKCIENIEDRLRGVQNDLKAFLYIRKENLQHKEDDIGGGNMVVALSLFTCINFLGKTYYCTIREEKFNSDGSIDNEIEVFIHYSRFLAESGLNLGLPRNGEELEFIWKGFRDYLAHRFVVEPGKQVLTFAFEERYQGTINDILIKAKESKAFAREENSQNMILNADSLTGNLPEIIEITMDHIKRKGQVNSDLLLKVIGVEYP